MNGLKMVFGMLMLGAGDVFAHADHGVHWHDGDMFGLIAAIAVAVVVVIDALKRGQ